MFGGGKLWQHSSLITFFIVHTNNSLGYQCAACNIYSHEYELGWLNQWCVSIISVNLSEKAPL